MPKKPATKPARRVSNTGIPKGWIDYNNCGRWDSFNHGSNSMLALERDEPDVLFSYVAAVGGASPQEIADAVASRHQTKFISNTEVPLNGSPGYRERYYGEEEVVLEGAEERLEIMHQWLAQSEPGSMFESRLKYQIEALTKDIECARVWKAVGAEFGPPVDKLMRKVKLPEGWKLVRTDHYMYTHLVDGKGRVRGQIGLKRSDRWASMFLYRRFGCDPVLDDDRSKLCYRVTDGKKEIWRTEVVVVPVPAEGVVGPPYRVYAEKVEEVEQELRNLCCAWLRERYPNFNDPAAHWDDE
jgi:hypothetical protein